MAVDHTPRETWITEHHRPLPAAEAMAALTDARLRAEQAAESLRLNTRAVAILARAAYPVPPTWPPVPAGWPSVPIPLVTR